MNRNNLGILLSMSVVLISMLSFFVVPAAHAAPATRVRTVEFFAGQDTSSARENTDTKHDLTAVSYQLAESSVSVIDAYIELTAQVGADSSMTPSTVIIYFDSCTASCAPSTAAVLTTGTFSASTGETQYIVARTSVLSEGDISAYTGGNTQKNFQVGYCVGSNASCTGTPAAEIQNAHAKLVITYTYDTSSATQTNTVLYPLENSTTGSKTSVTANCTFGSCPTFSFNAAIPEISSQLSQYFKIHYSFETPGSFFSDTPQYQYRARPRIDTNAAGSTVYIGEKLSENGGWFDHYITGLTGYANNTAQVFELENNTTETANLYALGGENIITYTYAKTAGTKTKTVIYPIGEVQTTGSTTKSSLIGPTVYLPESGVTIKKAWIRVHTSFGGAASATTLNVTSKVGSNSESGATGYSLYGDGSGPGSGGVSAGGYFNYMIPASDYTELEGATGSSGKAVQMTAQWVTTALGAVSAELVITYQYTSDAGGYMVSEDVFAGQQTANNATSYSTSTGAINPSFPEGSSLITIRGVSHQSYKSDTTTATNDTIGSDLTTSTCTASATSTTNSDGEAALATLFKSVTGVVTNNDATTYTACYISGGIGNFNGRLIITYQVDLTGVLDHYSVSITTPQTAGVCFTGTNTVTAQDGANSTLTSDTSTVTMTSSGTGITFYTDSSCTGGNETTQYTLSSGVGTLYVKTTVKQSSITITATRNGFTETGTSGNITVNAGSINTGSSHSTVTIDPSSTLVNTNATVTITLKDTWDNTITSYSGANLSFIGTTGLYSVVTAPGDTNGSGVSTATLKWGNAGTMTIVVRDSVSGQLVSSPTITISDPAGTVDINGNVDIHGGVEIN